VGWGGWGGWGGRPPGTGGRDRLAAREAADRRARAALGAAGERQADDRRAEQRADAARDHPGPRAEVLAHPADQGPRDALRAEQHQHVQRHDTPAQVRGDRRLHQRVAAREVQQRREAHGDEQRDEHRAGRGRGGDELDGPDHRGEQHQVGDPAAAAAGGQQRAAQGADGQHRGEQRVPAGVGHEHLVRERREHGRHVDAGERHEAAEHDRPEDPRGAAHVGQALPELPLRSGDDGRRGELGDPHRDEQPHGGEAGDAVDREGPALADRHDQRAGDRGPDETAQLEHRRVDADRLAQVLRPGDLVHERLPGGVVEDGREAADERPDQHVPGLDVPGERQHREGRGGEAEHRLGDHEHLAARVPVGDDATDQAEREHRHELQGHREADQRGGARQAEHEPVLRDAGGPPGGVGQHLRRDVEAEVPHAQRGDRRVAGARHGGLRGGGVGGAVDHGGVDHGGGAAVEAEARAVQRPARADPRRRRGGPGGGRGAGAGRGRGRAASR
jgi:hypothetical protein